MVNPKLNKDIILVIFLFFSKYSLAYKGRFINFKRLLCLKVVLPSFILNKKVSGSKLFKDKIKNTNL